MIEKMLTVAIKNKAQPIHWHDLLEINFVLEGEIAVVRNNKEFILSAGELLVLNREDVHSIKLISENSLFVQLHLDLEQYNQYIPEIWTVLFYCSPEENDPICQNLKAEIKSHIANIVQLMSERSFNIDAEKKINNYCIDILSSLKLGFSALNGDEGRKMSEEQKARLWKIIDYIYDNHNRKLTLHEVAQQVFVSDDYVSRILKDGTGRRFEEFIGFVRAEMSIRELLNTDKNITDISYDVGFSALKYYNAAFKKNYGCTPAEYRKKNRENFLMEKLQESSFIIEDEGVDTDTVTDLLRKYKLNYLSDQILKRIEIDVQDLAKAGEFLNEIRFLKSSKQEVLNYNIQREMSDIQFPYIYPEENVFIWRERNTIKILLLNIESINKKEYALIIKGLEKDESYIYCRARTPDIPQSIKKLSNSGNLGRLNREIIDNMYNMTYEYGESTGEEQIYMNIELDVDQIAKIVIQRI